jgi:hypothetical protein
MTAKQSASSVLKLLSAASVLLAGTALADGTVTAVYKVQELSFQYRLPRYSQPCHDLQARVANILLAVGARDDIKVDVRNCDAYMIGDDDMMDPMPGRSSDPFDRADPFERSNDPFNRSSSTFRNPASERRQSALIRIRLQMPVEMTPAVMKEVEKDKSRRELISRVTRNPGASMNDPILFEAQRQEVTLSSKTVRLKPEDCELLEQMSSQVFRKLDVKVTRRTASCGRDSSRIPPQMDVEALLPTGRIAVVADPEKQKRKTVVEPTDDPAAAPATPAEPAAEPTPPPPQQ